VNIDEFCNALFVDLGFIRYCVNLNQFADLSEKAKEFNYLHDGKENITDVKLLNEDSEMWVRYE